MALVLRGRVYYIYYREGAKVASFSLRTSSKVLAKHYHAEFMAARAARREAVALRRKFPGAIPPDIEALIPAPPKPAPRPALRVADMLEELSKIQAVTLAQKNAVRHFQKHIGVEYMRDVTPELALEYLERSFVGSRYKNYKSFNNAKTTLNRVFRLLAVSAGMQISPFAAIPSRKLENVESHRPLTDAEFRRVMENADEPMRTAAALGFYAGADMSTAFSLPGHAVDLPRRLIRWKRPKSGVWFTVGIHRELMPYLEALKFDPTSSDPILPYLSRSTRFKRFRELLNRLHIEDNAEGSAGFHSLRASFFTRCDAARLSRRTTNLAGAHKSDAMTDLYSHDVSAAHEVETLPAVLS